jgi:CRP-like cAMP-binding protein
VRDGTNFAEALLRETRRAGIDPAERRWPAGGFLYRQGFPTRGVLVLTGGLTKASIVAANGAEVLVCLMGPGRLLGDVEYFRGCPPCLVVALEPVSASPSTTRHPRRPARLPRLRPILGRFGAKLAENAERFERNFCYPGVQRPGRRLADSAPRAARPQGGAPGISGVSPRHLNRVLASLAADGLIRVESGSVAVADERAVRARIARTEEE